MYIYIYIYICYFVYVLHNLNDDVKRTCSIISIDLLFIDDVCMCIYI